MEDSVQEILVAMKQTNNKRTFSKIDTQLPKTKKVQQRKQQLDLQVSKVKLSASNDIQPKKQKIEKTKEAIIPPMFRNSYQLFNLCLPDDFDLQDGQLFINEPVAKIQTTEKYYLLNISMQSIAKDGIWHAVEQCNVCREEFARKNYFKQHPEFAGRALLVKNKYQVDKNRLQVFVKVMCCCLHQDCANFRFSIEILSDDKKQLFTCQFDALVKQWKKGCTKVLPVTVYLQ